MIANSATAAEQQPAVALLQLNGLLLLDIGGGMTFSTTLILHLLLTSTNYVGAPVVRIERRSDG